MGGGAALLRGHLLDGLDQGELRKEVVLTEALRPGEQWRIEVCPDWGRWDMNRESLRATVVLLRCSEELIRCGSHFDLLI